jgi:hypothetical protein
MCGWNISDIKQDITVHADWLIRELRARLHFRINWHQRDDPQVSEKDLQIQQLKTKIAEKDTKMAEKDLQIQQLNVALNQEENAGQEEPIRTTKRGNLVKRTKYQWIIDNKITETLSIQNAQYEQGIKYIQDMFDAFCQMSIKDIDDRTVADFDGEKVLGLSHIL